MTSSIHPPVHRFSLEATSEVDLYRNFQSIAENGIAGTIVEVIDVKGQDFALMAVEHPVHLHVLGPLGHYGFSYNLAADARVDGDVGNGFGEGLRGGSVRVRGNAGVGLGVAMRGGTLAVYGSAGDRAAAAMVGGELLVRGDVGADIGVGAFGGTVLIGGDTGPRLGEPHGELIVFLRGKPESLAPGMVEAPLRKRDELRIGLLLINASIRADAKDFRRIVSERSLVAERERKRGEVDPSWK